MRRIDLKRALSEARLKPPGHADRVAEHAARVAAEVAAELAAQAAGPPEPRRPEPRGGA